jgi:tetratricopeptide (TPR) repeat protein
MRFAIARQAASSLAKLHEYGRLSSLLSSMPETAPRADGASADPYGAWYLYTAAYAYEKAGSAPIAAIYYDRILGEWPDESVDGRSMHRDCLDRLIEIVDSPERRIGYYKSLLSRFPDDGDQGRYLFLLAKEYEREGDWDLAIKAYSEFLPYLRSSVPGYPDAFRYARSMVDLYNSPKDWTDRDLQALATRIRSALAAGDSSRLRGYRAKVGFFASAWGGAEEDSRSFMDFGESMSGGRISAAEATEMEPGGREAYLKTWGWADKIPTWYFCFRKLFFPADPELHGSWEWAGIYFGERP